MAQTFLTMDGCWFVWTGGYETKDTAKSAGMRWNPDRRRWETKMADIAAKLKPYADAKATAALAEVFQIIDASKAADANIANLPVPAGQELLPFQAAGIAAIRGCFDRGNGVLLADEMGLGKTIQALMAANLIAAKTILVICPATLRMNWRNEARRWLTQSHTDFIVSGGAAIIPADATLVIANDDIAWRKGIHDQLMARDWDMLIIDEAHRMKDQRSKRTKGVLGAWDAKNKCEIQALKHRAKRLMVLTGTPILNKPVEMWPLIHAVDPKTWTSFFGYAKRYCAGFEGKYGWDFTGASNLGELQTRLRSTCMIRRLKKDVLTELPPKRRQILTIPPNGLQGLVEKEQAEFAHHSAQLEDLRIKADLAHAAGDAAEYKAMVAELTNAARMAFTEMAAIRHEVGVAKAPIVLDHIIETLEATDKVVVFAHHHDVMDILRDGLAKVDIKTAEITGKTPMAARQAEVDAFQNDPATRVFIGEFTAAGVGITLTAASQVIFAELDWVPAKITQAEDRVHRIGQNDHVLIQHIVLDGSIDARMAEEIVAKQAISDAALDDEPAAPVVISPVVEEKRPPRPKKYPEATEAERSMALAGIRLLSARDPDRCAIQNGIGFNGLDGRIGHELARYDHFTDGQVWLAKRILQKYKNTQLTEPITSVLWPAE